MSLFSHISSNTAKKPQWLIVGLGNPGVVYEKTRHNAGFLALDTLAGQEHIAVDRLKFHALVGSGEICGVPCLLMKPQTYMNNSGQSVGEAAKFYKIPAEHILVFLDDITREPGCLRIRKSGSHGGHNGIKDIAQVLGSDNYPRIRLGIGDKPHPDYDLKKWVLSKLPPADWKKLETAAEYAADAARLIIREKADEAANRFNGIKAD